MKQETIKHPGNSFSASFQQKSTGVSLVITSSVAIYYFVNTLTDFFTQVYIPNSDHELAQRQN